MTRRGMGVVLASVAAMIASALYTYRRALRGTPRLDDYQVRPGWRPDPRDG